jgi:hypothetical protein
MSRRSHDWGFPRWRPYDGSGREASTVRTCDRHGCHEPATCPAPKAPDSPERWWFCTAHAAEYNRTWDYFARLSATDADAARARGRAESRAYSRAGHWSWGGSGDGSRSRAEMDALALFGLPPDADADAVKAAYRRIAKENHPDLNPGDSAAAERFRAAEAAYRLLSNAQPGQVRKSGV